MGVKGKIKRALIVVILAVLAIVTIFPIWFLIVNSFKGQQEIVASPIALPKSWNLDYLKNAAEQINLGSSLLQTVLITVAAVALIVVISSFAGMGNCQDRFQGGKYTLHRIHSSHAHTFPVSYVPVGIADGQAGTQKHTGSDPHVRRLWNQYVGSAVQRIHQEYPAVT